MKAIELQYRTDSNGILKVDYQLDKSDTPVKILILLEDENSEEELWIKSISKSKSFDFLKDKEEDIYSLSDGDKFND